MKKLFLFFLMLCFASSVFSQSKLKRDIFEAKQTLIINGYSIDGISNDSIIAVADSLKLVTQYAMKKYVDDNGGGFIPDGVTILPDGTIDTTIYIATKTDLQNVSVDTVLEIATKYDINNLDIYINVKDFGATGDGLTNDTESIQNALDSCFISKGTIYIPTGVYMVDELDIYSNTNIFGENQNSILKLNSGLIGSESVLNINKGGEKYFENITIKNITLDGNRSSYTSGLSTENELLDGDNTRNLSIINCKFQNGIADAIDLDGENVNLLIDGNYINNMDKMGMHIYGVKNGSIVNNIIDSIGLNLAVGNPLIAYGIDVINEQQGGFNIGNSNNVIISNNTISNSTGGINVAGTSNFNIIGNSILNTKTYDVVNFTDIGTAILTGTDAEKGSIIGNTIFKTNEYGIHNRGENIIVSSNNIDSCNNYSIYMPSTAINSIASNNNITSTIATGIFSDAGSSKILSNSIETNKNIPIFSSGTNSYIFKNIIVTDTTALIIERKAYVKNNDFKGGGIDISFSNSDSSSIINNSFSNIKGQSFAITIASSVNQLNVDNNNFYEVDSNAIVSFAPFNYFIGNNFINCDTALNFNSTAMVGTIIDDNNFINCISDFFTTGNYSSLTSYSNNKSDGLIYDRNGNLPTAGLHTLSYNGSEYVYSDGQNSFAGLSGNGTTNNILKYTTSNTVGNSVLFEYNNNIGLGTNWATKKLDIIGNNGSQFRISNTESDATIKNGYFNTRHYLNAEQDITALFSQNTATQNIMYFGGGTSIGNTATDIHFRTATDNITTTGTTRLYINKNGRIGIGTTSPNQLLDVEGGTVRFSDYGSGTVTGTPTKYLAVEADGDVIEVDAPTSTNLYNTDGTLTANRTITSTGQNLTFSALDGNDINVSSFNDNSVVFALTNTLTSALGNYNFKPDDFTVTNSPIRIINEDSKQLILGDSETNNTAKKGTVSSIHYETAQEPVSMMYAQNSSAANSLRIGGGNSNENAATVVDFHTAANNTTLTGTRVMRIDNSQNVQIGTSTATGEKLQIQGAVRIEDVLKLDTLSVVPTTPTAGTVYVDSGANTSSGSPEMLFYNGTAWVGSNSYTGWAEYSDGAYTVGAPLTVADGVKVTLPNNGASIIDSQKPIDIVEFYTSSDSLITGRNGDGLNILIDFKVKPTTAAETRITASIDIGGAVGEIYKRDFVLSKGNGVEHYYTSSFSGYTLNTWEANGGKVKIIPDGGGVEIYDIRYVLTRTHRAR